MIRALILTLVGLSPSVLASDVAPPSRTVEKSTPMQQKLLSIYMTYQVKEPIIQGCHRLGHEVGDQVNQAFIDYSETAKEYIQAGKKVLEQDLSAVDAAEWKVILLDSRKSYQVKFDKMALPDLKQECQQLVSQLSAINSRVSELHSK